MSLDIYLLPTEATPTESVKKIFVRQEWRTTEISRADWDALHPWIEPVYATVTSGKYLYQDNITHNLAKMADAVGLYNPLWHPQEIFWDSSVKAIELVHILSEWYRKLKESPETYKAMNPENWWGSYERLLNFVGNLLLACIAYPESDVDVSI